MTTISTMAHATPASGGLVRVALTVLGTVAFLALMFGASYVPTIFITEVAGAAVGATTFVILMVIVFAVFGGTAVAIARSRAGRAALASRLSDDGRSLATQLLRTGLALTVLAMVNALRQFGPGGDWRGGIYAIATVAPLAALQWYAMRELAHGRERGKIAARVAFLAWPLPWLVLDASLFSLIGVALLVVGLFAVQRVRSFAPETNDVTAALTSADAATWRVRVAWLAAGAYGLYLALPFGMSRDSASLVTVALGVALIACAFFIRRRSRAALLVGIALAALLLVLGVIGGAMIVGAAGAVSYGVVLTILVVALAQAIPVIERHSSLSAERPVGADAARGEPAPPTA